MKKWFAIAVSLALLTAVLCGCDETSPQYESGYEQGYSDGKESGYKEGLSDSKADMRTILHRTGLDNAASQDRSYYRKFFCCDHNSTYLRY